VYGPVGKRLKITRSKGLKRLDALPLFIKGPKQTDTLKITWNSASRGHDSQQRGHYHKNELKYNEVQNTTKFISLVIAVVF
jgi:hypothetical protein